VCKNIAHHTTQIPYLGTTNQIPYSIFFYRTSLNRVSLYRLYDCEFVIIQLAVAEIRAGQGLVVLNIVCLLYGSCYLLDRLVGVVLAAVTAAGMC
jgi:hypothetical protein